ncbi:MAG TPA: hypothetical protein VLM79_11945 [Kofleriaceae bacterium]|nr:hypothetical protein [Kofleriaceae bacterium]
MFQLRVLWLVVLVACGPSFHLPMSAAELAAAHDGHALILYLSQPSADPVVCDASAAGPHIAVDDAVERALVDGLRDGAIEPRIWRACTEPMLASADRAGRTALLDRIVDAYTEVITAPQIERDPRAQARLAALDAVYRSRAPESRTRPETAHALEVKLRLALAKRTTGPYARSRATEMLATLELERGLWGRRIIDVALLDQLVVSKSEAVLAWFAARLPDPALRAEARRRVIRLRIAGSPFGELRDDAAHVEAMMMELGRNPVSPRLQPPSRAEVDPARLAIRGVVVSQDVGRQTATLADAAAAAGARRSNPLTLRGALSVELAGLSRPITLCGAARDLDPSPCLLAGDITVASPLMWADRDGGLHLVEQMTARQAVELARGGAAMSLPIAVGGQPVTALEWPISFARPRSMVLAAGAGDRGPSLTVTVEEHLDRLIYTVDDGHSVRLAVAARADASKFRIVSAGGDGAVGSDGSSGSAGSDGIDGSSASCPSGSASDGTSGGNGGPGGDGGNGGDGGDGGDIRVVVICPDGACRETLAALRTAFESRGGHGGPGGSGGQGGRGGRGGAGGSGASCTDDKGNVTSVSGGSAGSSGSDGSSGMSGSSGSDGHPGSVQLSARRPAGP